MESLLNMAVAAPELKRFAFAPTILRHVTFDPGTDRQTMSRFLQASRDEIVADNKVKDVPLALHVQELRIANCLALSSDIILGCARHCEHLRELCVVNSVVEPAELFVLLSVRLTSVTNLQWSLHDEKWYQSGLNDNATALIRGFTKPEGPSVVTMYVEMVATDRTKCLLKQFLLRCGTLLFLHVHAVLKGLSNVLSTEAFPRVLRFREPALYEILPFMEDLATLKYTNEVDLSPKVHFQMGRQQEPSCPFVRGSVILSNVELQLKPSSTLSKVELAEMPTQRQVLRDFEQVTVYLKANSRAPSHFTEAAAKPEHWSDITRLTLRLTESTGTEFAPAPTAHRGYETPMRQFFETCVSHITELNLTAFHFDVDFDPSVIVASTLTELRALALPPCGANHTNTLETLADGCTLLEHLDVTPSAFRCCLPSSCKACQLPLPFTRQSFGLLQEKTRLRRLSINHTVRIMTPAFLLGCRVEELRFSLDSFNDEELAQCPKAICQLLSANPRLSSLTLVALKVTLSSGFAEALSQIQSLRHLCVLSIASHKYATMKDFFSVLEVRLPRLRSAHVHYACARNIVRRSTWIRQWRPRDVSQPLEGTSPTAQGVCLDDHPCLGRLCCVDTFIGLVRPRNRY
ncbi:hypothetical protein HPB52_003648 [Rhipicephalus sanguineus]|uniref:Uncharacterized protein n=1 Tax=Rhipicephalus sanguineus TaxID=34632 RepID=A0A9D4T515_RHISA|nr:hypothetical protein HPB52_003648 [Rhipicephalus sanguineus]